MSTGSETDFLLAVLSKYGYAPYGQDCEQLLSDLCQGNYQDFLEICRALVESIIRTLLRPVAKLENNDILEAMADDLNKILIPLWRLQGYTPLVNAIYRAQNLVSNGSMEKNRRSRTKFIENCSNALDIVHKLLSAEIL